MTIHQTLKTDPPSREAVIPIFRPAISEQEIQAASDVMRSLWLGPGQQVENFESAFAKSVNARFAISTCNATAAITATLNALAIEPGDEIIIPSFTYLSAFQVIRNLGATPVFADIEPQHLMLDPTDVAKRITNKTRAIISVHHGGQLADMDALLALAKEHSLWLIDDAAHATGAAYKDRPVGSMGVATCFSFSAVKNLTTGDGGMITTDDPQLAHKLALYRNLGLDMDTWARYGKGTENKTNRWAYNIQGPGQRIHMNNIAAAIGSVQLARLPKLNQRRKDLATNYDQSFADIKAFRSIQPRAQTSPNWHMYTVLMPQRDQFIDAMRQQNITVGVHYYPIHLYPIAKPYHSNLPVTEEIWQQVTTFPLYPAMTQQEQDRVIEAARALAP
ncbi:MAG: DegT/DnrJ/EryC1/StrS family aminotransferase [Gammaproteobacteria bacterium]|nr:DegT/DnrJ/EryC1/StrS family aminotransferase [Gammaproteobacteria bacterium]